jgi:hypothetical protein
MSEEDGGQHGSTGRGEGGTDLAATVRLGRVKGAGEGVGGEGSGEGGTDPAATVRLGREKGAGEGEGRGAMKG